MADKVTVRLEADLTPEEAVDLIHMPRSGAGAFLAADSTSRWQIMGPVKPSVTLVARWRSDVKMPPGAKAEFRLNDVQQIRPIGDSILVVALGHEHRIDCRSYEVTTEVTEPTEPGTAFGRFADRVGRIFGGR